MWLFSDAIASIRNRVQFEMRLTIHASARLAGRRVVMTTLTSNPLRSPLPPTQRAEVEVEYNNEGRVVREIIPTASLVPKEAHTGCCHVVIADCVLPRGTIVDISRIVREETRVVLKGENKKVKKNLITIDTSLLCPVHIVEPPPVVKK